MLEKKLQKHIDLLMKRYPVLEATKMVENFLLQEMEALLLIVNILQEN